MRTSPALLLLLLAGCSRDLAVTESPAPGAEGAPTLRTVLPLEAFAGDVIRIEGEGFGENAAANEIRFAAWSSPALSFDADGALLVRVPDDAGTGPITLRNSSGVSGPLEGFRYKGLGRLRRGVIVADVPILHRPTALAPTGSEVLFLSLLFDDLLADRETNFSVGAGGAAALAHAPTRGLVALARLDGGLSVLETSTGLGIAEDSTSSSVGSLELLEHADGSATLFVLEAESGRLRGLDLSTLAPVTGEVLLDPLAKLSPVDRDRVLVLASGALTLHDLQGGGGVELDLPLPPGAVVAALPTPAGGLGAVALEDGSVQFLTLGAIPTPAGAPVDTFSDGDLGDLLFVDLPAGPLLLATKPEEGVVMGIDATSRRVLFGIDVGGEPSVMAADADGRVFVAHRAVNQLSVVDPGTGRLVGRTLLPLEIGEVPGGSEGARSPSIAFDDEGALAIATTRAGGVLLLEPSSMELLGGFRHQWEEVVGVIADLGGLWVLHPRGAERLDTLPGDGSPSLTFPGAHDARFSVGAGDRLFVAGLDFLVAFEAGELVAEADLQGFVVEELGLLPGGLFAVGRGQSGAPVVRSWPDGAIEQPPNDAVLPEDASVVGVVQLEGAAFVIYSLDGDEVLRTFMQSLDAPEQAPTETPLLPGSRVVATSPDRRSVAWFDADGVRLHLSRLDSTRGLIEQSVVALPGDITGALFSEDGERLYVTITDVDRVLALE